jgi:BirA family biotin operon repressor/biotin-[acetyl-CoA-carboxylase] ligase
MKNEILTLLEKEGKLSIETMNEIMDGNIHDFSNTIKDIGKNETGYIKASEISKDLNTQHVGKDLYVYREVGSTNTLAKFLSETGAENGTVVIAEKQTAGKGRSGKAWESPLGGVWLSIILTPDVNHSNLPFITLATGVAVAKALEKIGIKNSEIKWPNDIIINDRKVCGILTEAMTKLNAIESVIIGVGIDVNVNYDQLPEELQEITTTVEKELKKKTDENHLIRLFLEEFEKTSELFSRKEYEEILKEWRKRSYTIGKTVEVRKPYNEYYYAYVAGIGKDGALVVEKEDGSLEKVISGECIIRN